MRVQITGADQTITASKFYPEEPFHSPKVVLTEDSP
jgi:hypothetical protein